MELQTETQTPLQLSRDRDFAMQKIAIKDGEKSNVKVGEIKRGKLSRNVQVGRVVTKKGNGISGKSIPLSSLVTDIVKEQGVYFIHTQTSVYKVL